MTTPESRLRAFCEDLLHLLDDRDGKALTQAAALAGIPTKRSKAATPPTSFVHEVAHGRVVMPLMPLAQAAKREELLEWRRGMREDCTTILDPRGIDERIRFEKGEEARYAAASELLRRGVSDGEVITRCGLFDSEELADIKQQIGM